MFGASRHAHTYPHEARFAPDVTIAGRASRQTSRLPVSLQELQSLSLSHLLCSSPTQGLTQSQTRSGPSEPFGRDTAILGRSTRARAQSSQHTSCQLLRRCPLGSRARSALSRARFTLQYLFLGIPILGHLGALLAAQQPLDGYDGLAATAIGLRPTKDALGESIAGDARPAELLAANCTELVPSPSPPSARLSWACGRCAPGTDTSSCSQIAWAPTAARSTAPAASASASAQACSTSLSQASPPRTV